MPEQKSRMSRGSRRPVAGREEILTSARAIGVRDGWKAVTIRAVAGDLGYTAPLLYQYFDNKEDILTQLAVEAHVCLEQALSWSLPEDAEAAILAMVGRYWNFMREHTQLYRLMNGMDGVPIDRETVSDRARSTFRTAGAAVGRWLRLEPTEAAQVDALIDEIWALLHGMAALSLDRSMRFDTKQAQDGVFKLLGASRKV